MYRKRTQPKSKNFYFADFETTTINDAGQVKVYLWCILNGDYCYTGNDLESFINHIKDMSAIIVFHNLKFDFSYIHYYLLDHNENVEVLEKKGQIYSVRWREIEFRDSMNFMPMTLKEVGENYCTKYQKTSIDYNVDYDHVATPEEITYCINDCRVLEEGFKNYFETLKKVLDDANCKKASKHIYKKLTNAGIAFEAFKELSNFDKLCPKTTNNEYKLFSKAYHGGYVYSNPKGIVENVKMIDCNSMYPYIYSTIHMPIGKPIKCNSWQKLESFKFYIVHCMIKYELKNGYIPIIGGSVSYTGSISYRASSNGEWEEITVCNTDLELIKEFYDYEITKPIWGAGFETKEAMYKEYADTFIAVKNKEKGIKRAVAKVLLNSPYGKTAMNGLHEIKTFFIDEIDGNVKSKIVGYDCDPEGFQYLPQAIAITAGARNLLLRTAKQVGFFNVMYMDTDSIKFICDKYPDINIDPNTLGAWKDEGVAVLYKTIAPKKYVYWDGATIHYTCAGFSKKILTEAMKHNENVTREEAIDLMKQFDSGLELPCLQSKVVAGGRALLPIYKKIN